MVEDGAESLGSHDGNELNCRMECIIGRDVGFVICVVDTLRTEWSVGSVMVMSGVNMPRHLFADPVPAPDYLIRT